MTWELIHESLTSREAISDMTPFFSVFGESFGWSDEKFEPKVISTRHSEHLSAYRGLLEVHVASFDSLHHGGHRVLCCRDKNTSPYTVTIEGFRLHLPSFFSCEFYCVENREYYYTHNRREVGWAQAKTYSVDFLEMHLSSSYLGQHGRHWILTHLCKRIIGNFTHWHDTLLPF